MKVDVAVVGAHPDDAELGAGGLLALARDHGQVTALICLTDGGAGADGSAEERAHEAKRGAAALGVGEFRALGLPDTGLGGDRTQVELLEALFVELAPRLIVTHSPVDWHPDHRAAWELVENAWALAARASRHRDDFIARPGLLQFAVDARRAPKPTVVIDITPAWERKRAALDCHRTQRSVLADIETFSRCYGAMIGAAYGEAFVCPEPLPVSSTLSLL